MDSGPARSILLPRPAGLSAYADRIWPHAHERGALRPDARLGNGPDFTDAAGGSLGDLHGRSAAARAIATGALDGRASVGTHGSQLPRAGPARVCPWGG